MKLAALVGCWCLGALGMAGTALAHERSESASHWTIAGGELEGVITVRTREVTRLAVPGDSYASLARILAAHLARSVAAAVDGSACVPARAPAVLESEPGYIRIGLRMRCAAGAALRLRVGILFDVAPAHHHFLFVESAAGARREAILTVSSPETELELDAARARPTKFPEFVAMGVGHIATGLDHLAFLLALLIAARTLRQVLLIVTGFTVGHSLTLALAVLGVVQADRGAVESLIGLTIALAAARNLLRGEREGQMAAVAALVVAGSLLLVPAAARPAMPGSLIIAVGAVAASWLWLAGMQTGEGSIRSRVAMATGFGLVHGVGFAGALQDLHLPRDMLVPTLVGFNLGVELGQLLAVAAALALVRALSALRPGVQATGIPAIVASSALLAVGVAWFLARAASAGQ